MKYFIGLLLALLLTTNNAFCLSWEAFQKIRDDGKKVEEINFRNEIYILGLRDGLVSYNRALLSIPGKEPLYCFPNEIENVDQLLNLMDRRMKEMQETVRTTRPDLPDPAKQEVADVLGIVLMKYLCPQTNLKRK